MKTCNHLHDTGEHCNSAAAVNRDYCVFHLGYRARQHRQLRTERKRFARIALQQNLRIAAEKLAAQNAVPTSDAATRKPPVAASEDSAAEAFAANKEEAIA